MTTISFSEATHSFYCLCFCCYILIEDQMKIVMRENKTKNKNIQVYWWTTKFCLKNMDKLMMNKLIAHVQTMNVICILKDSLNMDTFITALKCNFWSINKTLICESILMQHCVFRILWTKLFLFMFEKIK